ncbi:histidine phosphatase family protein [Ruegeria arenilitoris]|uniref:histidine phosphatase family protein n=1 Tax=Ruegeria arenilitoris TaxID=1173585 RepID=UPI00147AABFA|nr:histidine phosphatase family protein [Ruegeria arenilitoris]
MNRLALLRHGHTQWNRAGKIQGRTDIPLDAEARSELSGYSLPAPWNSAVLWSSPLERAKETAQLVAGRSPRISDALTEMDWGHWEGQRGQDLIAEPDSTFRHIEDWGWDYRPPQGESPAELWARLKPWLQMLQGENLAVCHIGIMRVILAKASGWEFQGPAPFKIKRNRLYIVHLDTMRAEPDPLRLPRHEVSG